MVAGKGPSMLDCFASLEDPRIERSKRHKLLDIIAIAICGADSWVHIELFGRSKEEWFRTFSRVVVSTTAVYLAPLPSCFKPLLLGKSFHPMARMVRFRHRLT